MRRWHCTTPVTSTPAATRASASGSSRPGTSPRPPRTRRTRSSPRPGTRCTGTRRSTRSPTTSPTCEISGSYSVSHEDNPYDLLGEDHDGGHRWAFGTGFTDPLEGIDTSVPAGLDAAALARYCLALGDDALIYSHRLQQWVTRLPELEEETAVANIALDLLGQARLLLARAGGIVGQTEDQLAFFREEKEFRNVRLAEHTDRDFAELVVRLLLFSTWRLALFERLAGLDSPVPDSTVPDSPVPDSPGGAPDPVLAAIA